MVSASATPLMSLDTSKTLYGKKRTGVKSPVQNTQRSKYTWSKLPRTRHPTVKIPLVQNIQRPNHTGSKPQGTGSKPPGQNTKRSKHPGLKLPRTKRPTVKPPWVKTPQVKTLNGQNTLGQNTKGKNTQGQYARG